jgi:riboflavin synthase
MFTGLIQNLGEIRSRTLKTIEVAAPILGEIKVGDSISVDGICLTAVHLTSTGFSADLSDETLQKTTAPQWAVGDLVNLELPLSASAPLGGHIVQGHVDTTGKIQAIVPVGENVELTISFPPEFRGSIVQKGSIAVDGVSLTVNSVPGSEFKVMIIPHTWEKTKMRNYRVGQSVNLEFDILAKYVQRAFEIFKETGVGVA